MLNFVTAIDKIYPSPLESVFLVLNKVGDLSLYRKNQHIWSAGRFKSLLDIEWSPDGKLLAAHCEKKILIYSAEDGKRIHAAEANENSTCRWLKIAENDTLILALIDKKSFAIKWIINCEFELKGVIGDVLKSNDPILSVQIDPESNNISILQSSCYSVFKLPFFYDENSKTFDQKSVLSVSKLSKQLQTVLRVIDEISGQFLKLLKLDDSIFTRVSEIGDSITKCLLFGEALPASLSSQITETEVLDWKSRLKKQHAELLVSVQELSSLIQTFSKNHPKFCNCEIDRFLELELPQLEDKSRLLQHDLAEFLVWLENLVIPDNQRPLKPFKPEARALEMAKCLKRSQESITKRHVTWLNPFNDFKLVLDLEFKDLLSKTNSIHLQPILSVENIPSEFNQILSTNPLALLNETGDQILKENLKITRLPAAYMTRYFKNNCLHIVCKGLIEVEVCENDHVTSNSIENSSNIAYSSPYSNQLFLVPSNDPTKLSIN